MSEIQKATVSTQMRSNGHEAKDFLQQIGNLVLSLQMKNPELDLDWATACINTDCERVDTSTMAGEWDYVPITTLYLEVEGVKRGEAT